jgi:hypothetical protein
MRAFARWFLVGWFAFIFAPPLFAQEAAPKPQAAPGNLIFRSQFYLPPSQKVLHSASEVDELLVVERANPELNSNVALVSGFAPQALRTRSLKGIQSLDQAKEWIQKNKKLGSFEGVSVVELPFTLPNGQVKSVYWVGNRSFDSFDKAAAEIAMAKTLVESQGGNFSTALALVEEFKEPKAVPTVEEVKTQAQFQKEEEIALRWADQLDIGEELWGPFQGVPAGEPILYQSFMEGSYRGTNLAEREWQAFVGFWTNRIIFKGIRFPINTIDPFVETTTALESTGNDGGSQLDLSIGAEWRPFERNAFLENFRPLGIPLLKWAKNYRVYVQWFQRRNIKDEIRFIRDEDFRFGASIFAEWGIDLLPIGQEPAKGLIGFLEQYTWGEYFGDYAYRRSNFTVEENYDALLFDTSVMLGFKTPPIPLPHNPINDHLQMMPYFRFSWTTNDELSNPFDNKLSVAVGMRWMPFRDYRFVNNEWLFKTKFFAEYYAIGKVRFLKQNQDNRPLPDEDWRIGVSFSLRRF